jgi:hypothetical protein
MTHILPFNCIFTLKFNINKSVVFAYSHIGDISLGAKFAQNVDLQRLIFFVVVLL